VIPVIQLVICLDPILSKQFFGTFDDRKSIFATLMQEGKKAILVLNKIDGMRHEQLLKLSSHLFESGLFSDLGSF
jgi:predicted GTPase